MLGYIFASLISAILSAFCALAILDMGWMMAGVAYLIGGWVGLAASLFTAMVAPDGPEGFPAQRA